MYPGQPSNLPRGERVCSSDVEVEEASEEELSDMTESETEVTWIEWYCGLKGHDYLIEVEESFIQDDFNLTGLSTQVPYFDKALDMILDNEYEEEEDPDRQYAVESAAQLLYGLVHSRFLLTSKGLHLMLHKYHVTVFGACPNTMCNGTAVVPVGLVDQPNIHTAKLFCPRCNEVHHPRKSSSLGKLDGAFFGTTFPHLFFLQYSSLVPSSVPSQYYRPKIYGFRVHKNVKDILREQSAVAVTDSSSSPSESSTSSSNADGGAAGADGGQGGAALSATKAIGGDDPGASGSVAARAQRQKGADDSRQSGERQGEDVERRERSKDPRETEDNSASRRPTAQKGGVHKSGSTSLSVHSSGSAQTSSQRRGEKGK